MVAEVSAALAAVVSAALAAVVTATLAAVVTPEVAARDVLSRLLVDLEVAVELLVVLGMLVLFTHFFCPPSSGDAELL